MKSLVSVIIPTYSRPENLIRAIDSVFAQTYHPIEIIVVDDNGINTKFQIETEELLHEYIKDEKIKYIKHEQNKNGSAARNTGVNFSTGKYIALLDDDDVFLPTKIEEQVNALEALHDEDSLYVGAYCNTIMDAGGKGRFSTKQGNLLHERLKEEIQFNSSTLLMYKDAYMSLNGFDERYLRHQDWEFILRFFLKGYKMALASPNEALLRKYKSPNLVTKNPKKTVDCMEFYLSNFKDFFESLPYSNDFYGQKYYYVAHVLLLNGYVKQGIQYALKSFSYKRPTIKQVLFVFRQICLRGKNFN